MSILVYTENWDGKFKKLSYELVSFAAAIAKELESSVTAISIGNVPEEELKSLGNFGANKVLNLVDDKYDSFDNKALASAIGSAAIEESAKVVLFAHNNIGKAVAPRVSVKLEAGFVSGITALPVSYNPFVVQKKVFTGKATANVKFDTEVKVLTFSQNSYEVVETENQVVIEAFNPAVGEGDFTTIVKDTQKVTGQVLLSDAEIVVSGGRGMKSGDNWGGLEELAKLLGAGLACSRPVSDEGWRSHSEHVGQTGKIIAPNLYFAFGISGAIQHLGGVSSSKVIVSVNKDAEAPIFETSDYGIIGDVNVVIPKLIEGLQEMKA